VKRDEARARRYELFGERYGGDRATRLEEDELVKQEEAELTDQTDTDDESDVESELDMEERAVLESQTQVCRRVQKTGVFFKKPNPVVFLDQQEKIGKIIQKTQ